MSGARLLQGGRGPRPLTVATALWFLDLGIVPVRVAFAGKRPSDAGWPALRPTVDDVARWGVCNVGALLGSASRGLTDIDLDCDEAIALAPYYLPTTWCFGRPSKPRSHYLYFAFGVTSKRFLDDDDVTVVEIRSEASTGSAHQTVLPPSIHMSGEPIDWDAEIGDGMLEPRAIDGRVLVSAVCKMTRAVLFARAGLSLDEARAAEAAHVPRLEPPQPCRARAVGHADRNVLDRARQYVARMPESVSGQGGHLACFRAAVACVRGFALGEADALEVLQVFNTRCAPPWSERELLHKISSATKTTVPRGYLLEGAP